MALVIKKKPLPSELRDVILSGKCIAFIGSGLSAGCYDPWHELINKLCKHCNHSSRVGRDSPTDAFLDAAQDAKDTDEKAYYSFLGEHFGRPAQNASLLYDVVLSLPFRCYLTVNFDPLLALKSRTAQSKCDTNISAYPSLDRGKMTNRSIHYLHGYIEEGSTPTQGTIVLARSEFDEAYADNSSLMNFLLPTFVNDPIVFIGCGLKEPAMKQVFSICKKHQQERLEIMKEQGRLNSKPPKQFIFLPKPEVRNKEGKLDINESQAAFEKKKAYYNDMEITPVWYAASREDHSTLRYALELLAKLPKIAQDYGWDGGVHVP
jgi:SIR2-like domain